MLRKSSKRWCKRPSVTATIYSETVVVQADAVAAPAQVRFCWHKVANPNLANKEGLPASPFQTDNWQGGTGRTDPADRRGTSP